MIFNDLITQARLSTKSFSSKTALIISKELTQIWPNHYYFHNINYSFLLKQRKLVPCHCRTQRVFANGITAWAPKLCAQINEKQLTKNVIYSNLRGQNLHCNIYYIFVFFFFFFLNQSTLFLRYIYWTRFCVTFIQRVLYITTGFDVF